MDRLVYENCQHSRRKKNFRALINRVRAGASILLLDDGQPVARLEPVGALSGDDYDGRLLRLVRAGIVRPGRTDPPQAQHNR